MWFRSHHTHAFSPFFPAPFFYPWMGSWGVNTETAWVSWISWGENSLYFISLSVFLYAIDRGMKRMKGMKTLMNQWDRLRVKRENCMQTSPASMRVQVS